MANTEGVAGVDSYVLFGAESTYNTPVAVTTHFGLVRSFNPTTSNTNNYSRGFKGTTTGGRNVAKVLPGRVENGLSIDFEVVNWEWLEHVLGSVSGSGPYTYSEADVPSSLTIGRQIVNPGGSSTDRDEQWSGAVIDRVVIKAAVGEPVMVTMDVKSSGHLFDTTVQSEVALPSVDVFNFSEVSLELPNGSVLDNIIDSIEITITNNWEILYGLGSRLGQNAKPRSRDYKIKFSVKYLDNALLTAMLGAAAPSSDTTPTEYATLAVTFALGGKSADFVFSTVTFDDLTGRENVNEVIGEDISATAVTLTVTDDRSA